MTTADETPENAATHDRAGRRPLHIGARAADAVADLADDAAADLAADLAADVAADLAADDALADAYADREPDSDVGVAPPRLSVPQMLRAARHFADVSQRELAARSGVSKSVVADVESGRTRAPSFSLVARLLEACGLRLVLTEPSIGVPVFRRAHDEALDRGGRHWPGHLEVRPVRNAWDWWFGVQRPANMPLPEFTADWRRLKDRPRARRRTKAERMAGARARNTPGTEVTGGGAADG